MKKLLTILVLMPSMVVAQWSSQDLSEGKFYTQAAAAMGKALFIGGAKPGNVPSKKVEIFDFATNGWQTRDMATGRVLAGVVVADSLVFIAGGLNPQTGGVYSSIEIYDVKNDLWKPSSSLSVARASTAAIRAGDELWFAGGYVQTSATAFTFFDIIDIYDLNTGTWTIKYLSIPRICSGTALGDKVVLAGGQSLNGPESVVDIYNTTTGQWSIAEISVPRMNMAVAVAGKNILFAGGSTYIDDALDVVDIWNADSNTWMTANLSAPRALIGAGTVCGTKAIFAGGGKADWDTKFLTTSSNKVDIFDAATGQWSQDTLAHARSASFAAASNEHFFMGAGWYPEASEFLKSIEIYTCQQSSGLQALSNSRINFDLSPNPGNEAIDIKFNEAEAGRVDLFDLSGKWMSGQLFDGNNVRIWVEQFPTGHYVLRVVLRSGKTSSRIWEKTGK